MPLTQFTGNFTEGIQGFRYILQGMHGRGDKPQHQLPLRYNRIGHDGTENTIVLPEANDHVERLVKRTFHESRANSAVGISDINAFFAEPALKRIDDSPSLILEFGVLTQQFEPLV